MMYLLNEYSRGKNVHSAVENINKIFRSSIVTDSVVREWYKVFESEDIPLQNSDNSFIIITPTKSKKLMDWIDLTSNRILSTCDEFTLLLRDVPSSLNKVVVFNEIWISCDAKPWKFDHQYENIKGKKPKLFQVWYGQEGVIRCRLTTKEDDSTDKFFDIFKEAFFYKGKKGNEVLLLVNGTNPFVPPIAKNLRNQGYKLMVLSTNFSKMLPANFLNNLFLQFHQFVEERPSCTDVEKTFLEFSIKNTYLFRSEITNFFNHCVLYKELH